MKVYLACYAHPEHAGPGPLMPISNSVPDWFRKVHGGRVADLVPLRTFIPHYQDVKAAKAGHISPEIFMGRYGQDLAKTWTEHEAMLRKALEGEPTLFCYEAPGEMCHRRALAMFLREKGYEVLLDGKSLPTGFSVIPQPPQVSLF